MIEVTDAMRFAIPDPCYECQLCADGGNDCAFYPADMIGWVTGKEIWACSFCVEDGDVLGLHWDENDEPVYEREWGAHPDGLLPVPWYVCAWGDCGAEATFRAWDLHWEVDGFYCCDHWRDQAAWLSGPTLAEVLDEVG